jgi:hypothetical protein
VAPICTLAAYVLLMRSTWKSRWSGRALALAWTTILITGGLGVFLAGAMIAAMY